MIVNRLQTAYLPTRDMRRMRDFYESVLALPLKFADAERWSQYQAGAVNFALSSADEAPESASGAVLVFEVDEFDERHILKAGGRILGVRDMGHHGRAMTVADPEGNLFQLFCRA